MSLTYSILIVYGFVDNFSKEAITATAIELSGTMENSQFKTTVEIDWTALRSGKLVKTLAAREMIRDLEEGISYLHNNTNLTKDQNALQQSVQREIIFL